MPHGTTLMMPGCVGLVVMSESMIQTGDVFANEFSEYTVLTVRDDRVEVETLAGTTKWMETRELIEVALQDTGRVPVTE